MEKNDRILNKLNPTKIIIRDGEMMNEGEDNWTVGDGSVSLVFLISISLVINGNEMKYAFIRVNSWVSTFFSDHYTL